MPQSHFVSKLKRDFSFMDILSKISENSCSVSIKNSTRRMATIPTGVLKNIEIPITTVKPCHYRISDINTLIHSVVIPAILKQLNYLKIIIKK